MKYFVLFIFSISVLSCNKNFDTTPSTHLNTEQQEKFKYDVIRYVERLPSKATNENKFDTIFDKEYKTKAKKSDLLYLYIDKKNNITYFAITKIAPSLKLKKVATVGKLSYDSNGSIINYEEGFRTWKMEEKELKEKTDMLFNKYINQKELTPYYTKNSIPDYYIEFPDDNTHYDKASKSWITKMNIDTSK